MLVSNSMFAFMKHLFDVLKLINIVEKWFQKILFLRKRFWNPKIPKLTKYLPIIPLLVSYTIYYFFSSTHDWHALNFSQENKLRKISRKIQEIQENEEKSWKNWILIFCECFLNIIWIICWRCWGSSSKVAYICCKM